MLRTKYPELKMKVPKKAEINRGFNVTRSMAKEYLDDLAAEINFAGIGDPGCGVVRSTLCASFATTRLLNSVVLRCDSL